jgi:hypothetical protein
MLGLGLGLLHTRPAAGGFIQAFLSRVKKDGGTVEGKVCLKLQTNVLKEKEETI